MTRSFIAIIGPPRSGNSLAGDMVERAGYFFGNNVLANEDLRKPRHFHRVYSNHDFTKHSGRVVKIEAEGTLRERRVTRGEMKIDNLVGELRQQGIDAILLLAYFRGMLPALAGRIPEMRVVVCKRKLLPAIRSHVNLALGLEPLSYGNRWFRFSKAWAAGWAVVRRAWWCHQVVHNPLYTVLELPFERVLAQDEALLRQLAVFLGMGEDGWWHLGKAIRPETSEFS